MKRHRPGGHRRVGHARVERLETRRLWCAAPLRVNFQPSGTPAEPGFLVDNGLEYGHRDDGLTYGWDQDNTAGMRDRDRSTSPDQAYDTLAHFSGYDRWHIAVPDGTYAVHLVAGDADYYDSVYSIAVEGNVALSAAPDADTRWFDGNTIVRVTDGRLTVTSAEGARNNKICFIEITAISAEHAGALPVELMAELTTAMPAAPSNLLASRSSSSTIDVTWQDNSSNETGFKIERKLGDYGAWQQIAQPGAGTTFYRDSGLLAGTRYVYRARAYNSAGNSAYSNTDGSTTLIGGSTQTNIIQWSTRAASPITRAEAQGAAIGSKLYTFGGANSSGPFLRSDVYDSTTNIWSRLPDMPERLTHGAVVVDGRNIIIAGGYVGTGNGFEQVFATKHVWRFNVDSKTWSRLADLPVARGSGGAAIIGRTLHFFGGNGLDRKDVGTHYALNLDGGTSWSTRASMPNPRTHLGAASIGGKIYAIGGQHYYDSAAICQSSVHMYDPATNTWTAVASLPRGLSHHFSSTLAYNGRIIVLGGETAPGAPTAAVHAFDPATNRWIALTSLPSPRTAGLAAVIGKDLYFSTGSNTTTTYRGVFV